MNAYRLSVCSLSAPNNKFGRRMSLLSHGLTDISDDASDDSSQPSEMSSRLSLIPTANFFRNPKFYLFMLHGFLSFIAFLVPQQFVPSQIVSVGLGHSSGTKALFVLAVANLVGRLGCGLIMDIPLIGAINAYIASHIAVGLANLCLQFCTTEGCNQVYHWPKHSQFLLNE